MSRNLSFFLCILVVIGIQSACVQPSANTDTSKALLTSKTSIEIPKLLNRNPKLYQGKEWDDVQNYYGAQSAALSKDANNHDASLKLAELFIQEARITGEHPHYYPAALTMLEPVIAFYTSKPDPKLNEKDMLFRALSHKASVQLSLHAFGAAKETAAQAVAINPYNAYIYGCLVDANVELGQYAQAVEVCDKMVAIRPDLRSYARVSYLREIHNDHKGAIEAMEMAVKAGYPSYEQTEWARLQLGKLYEKYGKESNAIAQYETCLAYRPEYPFAIAALAELDFKKGNYEVAEKRFNQAADIIPEVSFYVFLAQIYQKTNRKPEADALIAKIKTMIQEDMDAGHNMALEAAHFYLEVCGDKATAQKYADQEYASRPDNKDVKALMAKF